MSLAATGKQFKALRLSLGLTQAQTADRVNVNINSVRAWEARGAEPLPLGGQRAFTALGGKRGAVETRHATKREERKALIWANTLISAQRTGLTPEQDLLASFIRVRERIAKGEHTIVGTDGLAMWEEILLARNVIIPPLGHVAPVQSDDDYFRELNEKMNRGEV